MLFILYLLFILSWKRHFHCTLSATKMYLSCFSAVQRLTALELKLLCLVTVLVPSSYLTQLRCPISEVGLTRQFLLEKKLLTSYILEEHPEKGTPCTDKWLVSCTAHVFRHTCTNTPWCTFSCFMNILIVTLFNEYSFLQLDYIYNSLSSPL